MVELLLYVSDLVEDRADVEAEIKEINGLEALPTGERNLKAGQIYARLEKRLSPKPYSVQELRTRVGARFPARRIQAPFAVLFLPEAEQGVARLELQANEAVQKMLPVVGRPRLEKFVTDQTYATILEGTTLDASGRLNFSAAESRYLKLPPPWLKLVEKSLAAFINDLGHLLVVQKKSVIPLTPKALEILRTVGMSSLSKEGGVEDLEQNLVTKNGDYVPVIVTASALRGTDGSILGAVISAKDIRKILELEEEKRTATLTLLQSVELEKNKLASTLESIGDGAFVVDKQERITFFNRVAEEISGYSAKEAMGKPFREILKLVRESDRSDNYGFVEEAMNKGVISHITNHTLLLSKDGREVSIADSAAPIKRADGKVTGCIVIFRDVTRERIDEKMKGEFISLASHQLRTPLAGLRWLSDYLLSSDLSCLSKEQREFVSDLNKGASRMTEIVNTILNIARIEGNRLAVRPKPVDVKDVVASVLQVLQPLIREKKQNVTTSIAAIPRLMTDEHLIAEALTNLLSNAIKYTPAGGKIEIKVAIKGSDVIFSVKDNGYGIPEGQQHLAFTKFFRGENIVGTVTEGTGLGLYVVQKVVELLGGKIWFTSKENKGTTFFFTIPLAGTKPREGTKQLS